MIEFIDNKDGTTTITNFASNQYVKCLVDTEDVPRILEISKNWFYHKERGYVLATPKGKTVEIHRLINQTPEGMMTDHINGDKLDNRKINLRSATYGQNSSNRQTTNKNKKSSKYVGVFTSINNTWRAIIRANHKNYYLGTYTTEEDAARAYNIKAKELNNDFAVVNNVPNPFDIPTKINVGRPKKQNKVTSYYISEYKYSFADLKWKISKYKDGKTSHVMYCDSKELAEVEVEKLKSQKRED